MIKSHTKINTWFSTHPSTLTACTKTRVITTPRGNGMKPILLATKSEWSEKAYFCLVCATSYAKLTVYSLYTPYGISLNLFRKTTKMDTQYKNIVNHFIYQKCLYLVIKACFTQSIITSKVSTSIQSGARIQNLSSFHIYSFMVCKTTMKRSTERCNLSRTSLQDTWNKLFLSNFLKTLPFSSTNCKIILNR